MQMRSELKNDVTYGSSLATAKKGYSQIWRRKETDVKKVDMLV